MSKCVKCGEEINLLNAITISGPLLIWECPYCHSENYERVGTKPIDPYVKKIIEG